MANSDRIPDVDLVYNFEVRIALRQYAVNEVYEEGIDLEHPAIPPELVDAVFHSILSEHKAGTMGSLLVQDLRGWFKAGLGKVGVTVELKNSATEDRG